MHILRKKTPMPKFCLLIFHQRSLPSLTTEEAITWLWVEPSLSHMASRLFDWEISECVWTVVCPIECICPLVHLGVVSCLYCSSSYIQMIAGIATRTFFFFFNDDTAIPVLFDFVNWYDAFQIFPLILGNCWICSGLCTSLRPWRREKNFLFLP